MQVDTVKLWFTYLIALVIIVGGGAALLIVRNDADPSDLQLVIAGFMGAAISFVFNRESATQATRASQSSVQIGAAAGPPP